VPADQPQNTTAAGVDNLNVMRRANGKQRPVRRERDPVIGPKVSRTMALARSTPIMPDIMDHVLALNAAGAG
jgi:hypothetical protein